MATLKDRLQIAAVKLEEAREAVIDAQEEYDALWKQATGGKGRVRATASHEDEPDEAEEAVTKELSNGHDPAADGIPSRIVTSLKKSGKSVTAKSLAATLSANLVSVRSALYILKKRGSVEKLGRDQWALKEGSEAAS